MDIQTHNNEEPTELDRKIIVNVYSSLLKYGAVSTPRLMGELRYDKRTILWAMYQLDASEQAGLWTLPESKLPKNWQ